MNAELLIPLPERALPKRVVDWPNTAKGLIGDALVRLTEVTAENLPYNMRLGILLQGAIGSRELRSGSSANNSTSGAEDGSDFLHTQEAR